MRPQAREPEVRVHSRPQLKIVQGETPVETADMLLSSDRYELEYAISVDPAEPA